MHIHEVEDLMWAFYNKTELVTSSVCEYSYTLKSKTNESSYSEHGWNMALST